MGVVGDVSYTTCPPYSGPAEDTQVVCIFEQYCLYFMKTQTELLRKILMQEVVLRSEYSLYDGTSLLTFVVLGDRLMDKAQLN